MAHPNSIEGRPTCPNPFEGLIISDNSILNSLENRYICGNCHKSRKYFCYTCFTPHPDLKDVIPQITLPINIDIIKHRKEIDGKSTAAHAAILASENVKIYTYPDIPSYDEENVVLIFPTHTALEIYQLFNPNVQEERSEFDVKYPKGFHRGTLLKQLSKDSKVNKNLSSFVPRDNVPITKAVFIDSTWNQSKGIYKDVRIKKLPCVVLQNRVSQFWRHQRGSPRWYLATIEAIHQFLLEIHVNTWGVHGDYKGLVRCFVDSSLEKYSKFVGDSEKAYNGQYDNLLYFFQHMYKLIHTYYDHEDLHAYQRRMTYPVG